MSIELKNFFKSFDNLMQVDKDLLENLKCSEFSPVMYEVQCSHCEKVLFFPTESKLLVTYGNLKLCLIGNDVQIIKFLLHGDLNISMIKL